MKWLRSPKATVFSGLGFLVVVGKPASLLPGRILVTKGKLMGMCEGKG